MKRAVSVRRAVITAELISAISLKAKEMLGMRLCVLHNLYFYNTMMEEIRDALDKGCYEEYKAKEAGEHGIRRAEVENTHKKSIKFEKTGENT